MSEDSWESSVRHSVKLVDNCGLPHHLLPSHDSSSPNFADNRRETLCRRVRAELVFRVFAPARTAGERRIFVERIHVIISSRFETVRRKGRGERGGKREQEIPLPLG